MNTLISAVIDRPRPALLVLAVLLVAGVFAYTTIPKESEPDIAIPMLYINMIHEGISPEDAERLLIRPMENELRTIEGVKEMRATAAEGSAVLILEFDAGFDSDQALTDVREKVDLAKAELVPQSPEHGHEDDVRGVLEIVESRAGPLVEETPAGAAGECTIAERSATPAAAGLVGVTARARHGQSSPRRWSARR